MPKSCSWQDWKPLSYKGRRRSWVSRRCWSLPQSKDLVNTAHVGSETKLVLTPGSFASTLNSAENYAREAWMQHLPKPIPLWFPHEYLLLFSWIGSIIDLRQSWWICSLAWVDPSFLNFDDNIWSQSLEKDVDNSSGSVILSLFRESILRITISDRRLVSLSIASLEGTCGSPTDKLGQLNDSIKCSVQRRRRHWWPRINEHPDFLTTLIALGFRESILLISR